MTNPRAQLLGSWRTDPSDGWSLREYGDVSLHFDDGGNLLYVVHLADRQQIMHLTYGVDGNWLVTNPLPLASTERSFTLRPTVD
jgi:hypothetical protein